MVHQRLTAALSPAAAGRPAFTPHVTVARATRGEEAARLEAEATRLTRLRFLASAVSVVMEDARGRWVERGRLSLGTARPR